MISKKMVALHIILCFLCVCAVSQIADAAPTQKQEIKARFFAANMAGRCTTFQKMTAIQKGLKTEGGKELLEEYLKLEISHFKDPNFLKRCQNYFNLYKQTVEFLEPETKVFESKTEIF